jgi:hypothetical protein
MPALPGQFSNDYPTDLFDGNGNHGISRTVPPGLSTTQRTTLRVSGAVSGTPTAPPVSRSAGERSD